MVDKHLILRKFATLEEYLSQMNEYVKISLKDYADERKA